MNHVLETGIKRLTVIPLVSTALIVRLLTGRFIGEYDPTLEAVYSYQVPLPGHTLPLQVMDTAGQVSQVPKSNPFIRYCPSGSNTYIYPAIHVYTVRGNPSTYTIYSYASLCFRWMCRVRVESVKCRGVRASCWSSPSPPTPPLPHSATCVASF